MRIEHMKVEPNRRPAGALPSRDANLLLWDLQQRGVVFELSADRRRVRVLNPSKLTAEDRAALAREFHALRDLLRQGQERPS